MKKFTRFSAFLLIFILLISSVPFVFAESKGVGTAVSGTVQNEQFANIPMPLQGSVKAPLYYSSADESSIFFEPDESAVSALIRQGLLERKDRITIHYQADFAFPTDQQAANEAAYEIANDLFNGALVETDEATEGDSLRYCYHFWDYEGGITIYANKTEITLTYLPTYFTTKVQEDELSAKVDEVIASFAFTSSTTELEKIQTIYDYITKNIRYDYDNLENSDYILKFSAYAALIHKTAVCEGYAVLFYRMAEEAGLDARVITGLGGSPTPENHAWNIVKLEDAYYYLDSTWDEGRVAYSYFLKGDNDFPGHTNDAKFDAAEFRTTYPIAETGYVFEESPEGTVYTDGYYEYTVSGGKATIVSYTGAEENIIVPAKLGKYPVDYIGSKVFYGCKAKTITFSEGIYANASDALDYCNELTAVHYPSTMTVQASVSGGITCAPSDCPKLATVTVAPGNPYIKTVDGVLYDYAMKTLLLCPPNDQKTKFVIPEGVTTIAPNSIADHQTITEVLLPDSVTTIASFAFTASYSLEKADIPAVCETIGQYIFTETKVSSVHIPATVTKIQPFAFDFCNLTSITVDKNNPYFQVTNGVLHDGVRAMRSEVDTKGCVTIPDGITTLENGLFRNATDITQINLPTSLTYIGGGAFDKCNSLTHLTIPEGVEEIKNLAFGNCDRLVSLIIPDSITKFGEYLLHPHKHVTIYGGTKAQEMAWAEGVNYKPLSEFVCENGHDLQETVTQDTQYLRYYHYQCSICDGKTTEFIHYYPQISEAILTLSFTEATYTGAHIAPQILSVVYRGKTLVEGTDYVINCGTNHVNADKYTIGIYGRGEYRGIKVASYEILHADIATATIIMPETNFEYNGTPITPEFSVIWGGSELKRYEDYGFHFENNNQEGIATLVVTGNQNFKGEIRKEFAIGEHDHSYTPTQIDEYTHKGICACGRTTAEEAHKFDTQCDYYCNDCYYYRIVEHSYSDVWKGDLWRHYRECTICTEVCDLAEHSGGNATCTSAPVCDVCHLAYGDPLPHDWNTDTLASDPLYHWNPCKNCSAGISHELHHGGQATCTKMGSCIDCGYEYQNILTHSFTSNWSLITAQGHSRTCSTCGAPDKNYAHTYNSKGICSACGYNSGKQTDPKPQKIFTDVKSSDYFSTPVLWAVKNNVTSGTSNTTFSPNDFCTRAQVVTFLWRAAGSPKINSSYNPFTDVKKGQYYYNAVLWAVENGITSGVSAHQFAPEDTCTRGQIVAFLYRFAGQPKASGNNPFTDVRSSQYYYKAVLWAVKNNITTGVDATHFAPNDTCTRAQVVTFLYRHIS